MARSQTESRISRPDLLLIGGLLLTGAVSLLAVQLWNGKRGESVRITVDGNLYGTYSLEEEQEIPVMAGPSENGGPSKKIVTNILRISGRKAKMTEADCPDKLCVRQHAVSKQGETIVCLPNRVVVEITGEEPAEFDSISR